MQTERRTADEQYRLIMECRSSGLSDFQWCNEHGIKPGTFYNWVKRLRKKSCYDIPPATGNNPGTVIWIAAIAVCGAAVTITSACRYKKENR